MILITGATGSVGRELTRLLVSRGKQVIAVTRNRKKLVPEPGVTIVEAEPSDPSTLLGGLNRVDAVFVSPRAFGTRDAARAVSELLTLAAPAGARRVVAISAVTVEHGGGHKRFSDAFKAIEDAVKASRMEWAILRCSDFAANTLAWSPQIRATGKVRGAYGDAATSTIDERDVAAVAAQVLTDAALYGHAYLLTGPTSVSQKVRLLQIGEAIGKTLLWEETAPETLRAAMIAQGLPSEVPDRLLGYLADNVQQPGPTTDAVERILGRPARSFADWAKDHADAFQIS